VVAARASSSVEIPCFIPFSPGVSYFRRCTPVTIPLAAKNYNRDSSRCSTGLDISVPADRLDRR